MISTFLGLEIGKRGVLAHRTALEVTSHNIVNADSAGYSRQRVNLVATDPYTVPQLYRSSVSQQIGTGVTDESINRIRSLFLDKQMHTQLSIQERWDTRADHLTRVQQLLNEPSDDGIRTELEEFWKALEDLSNDPETSATRQVLIERGIGLSASMHHLYEELLELRENINLEFEYKINDINSIAEQITFLNQKIKSITNIGDNPNDLLDRRDLLIEDLAKLININTDYYGYQHEELVISVGGQTLVQGAAFNKLSLARNDENNGFSDPVWSNNHIPLSSDEKIFTAFANSSVVNQTNTLTVLKLAKTHMLEGQKSTAYKEQAVADKANHPEIKSGYIHINGKRMFVNAEKESLLDIVKNINALDAGVFATLSEDGLNRLIIKADQSGADNSIDLGIGYFDFEKAIDDKESWLGEMGSNILEVLGLNTCYWGSEAIINPDDNLYSLPNSMGLSCLPSGGGTFIINGYSINISPTNPAQGTEFSLRDLRNLINDREKNPNIGVRAIIVKDDSGRYNLVLEGEKGNYNYSIRDNDGIFNRLGINVSVSKEEIAGSVVSGTWHKRDGDGEFPMGLLDYGSPSTFRLTDSEGNSVNITVDRNNDSIEKIAQLINSGTLMNFVDAEAKLVETPDGEFRLAITSFKGNELTIESISGNLLEKLKIREGTYTNQGPLDISGQNAEYIINGTRKSSASNLLMDDISGATIVLRGLGSAVMEVRNVFQSGAIKGLLEARDEIVPAFIKQLDELAYSFAQKMNEIHYQGFGADGNSQREFFKVYRSGVNGDPAFSAARSIGVTEEVINNVNLIAAARPDSILFVSRGLPVSAGIGDGSNAIEMAKLKQRNILNDDNTTFDDFFVEMIAKVGVQAQEATRMGENQKLLINRLENERQAIMGVSLDEEMTNIVKFQHAFQASARVINTMDTMLDTIINRMKA